jgi:hypothetical protein
MKIFNKVSVLVIILIGVTLLFAILGSLQIKPIAEGFDSTVGCSGEIVPECHDKVLKFAKYDEDVMDDYILKTEIVVPTCPTCPSFEDKEWENGEWRPRYRDEHRDDEPNWDESNDYYNETKWESSKETTINSETNIKNETNINKTAALPEPVQTKTPPTTTPPPANVGLAGSATPMSAEPSSVSTPAAAINKDTPPCPACERCPEPAFECKKVPNYRSQSMQNYMPLPILNDFSKF